MWLILVKQKGEKFRHFVRCINLNEALGYIEGENLWSSDFINVYNSEGDLVFTS